MAAKKTPKTPPEPQEDWRDTLLKQCLDTVELVLKEHPPIHAWEFFRKQAGAPNPQALTSIRERLIDAIG